MKVLFWNMKGRALDALAAALVADHDVDVFLIAEPARGDSTLAAINATMGGAYRDEPGPRRDRIRILSRLAVGAIRPVADTHMARIVRVASPRGDVLLAAVHVGSKLFAEENDQLIRCIELAQSIADAERRVALGSRTMVVGDFNANPFDKGLTGTKGFHAVMSQDIARAGGRSVDSTYYRYFYNPMWSFLGDHPVGMPAGTYYYPGKHFSTIWHMLDQVLVRPELLDRFSPESVEIVQAAGTSSLVTAEGRPARGRASDHLPIIFELET